MNTRDRLRLLAECSGLFEEFTGPFDQDLLWSWMVAEFTQPEVLDSFVARGTLHSRAVAPERLLHVLSENTPHAAFQSLLRGLMVGAGNLLKLPSSGLPELDELLLHLPPGLQDMVDTCTELPVDWASWAQVVVVFGTDETLAWFSARTPATTRLLGHGQKLSIALVTGDPSGALPLAARDIGLFDQRGCLSVHDVYVSESAGIPSRDFAARLAREMTRFEAEVPRRPLSAAEASRITALREEIRFSAATSPDQVALWESSGSTAWTVVFEDSPRLRISPLDRFVYVKPWPGHPSVEALGPDSAHLASLAVHPFPPPHPESFLVFPASRVCPLGRTQEPSLFWHHDGRPSLADLVRWVDLG